MSVRVTFHTLTLHILRQKIPRDYHIQVPSHKHFVSEIQAICQNSLIVTTLTFAVAGQTIQDDEGYKLVTWKRVLNVLRLCAFCSQVVNALTCYTKSFSLLPRRHELSSLSLGPLLLFHFIACPRTSTQSHILFLHTTASHKNLLSSLLSNKWYRNHNFF